MISIYMNDLSMWLLMYEQESSCLSGNQYVINLFFIIIIVFFHHSKIIIIVFF